MDPLGSDFWPKLMFNPYNKTDSYRGRHGHSRRYGDPAVGQTTGVRHLFTRRPTRKNARFPALPILSGERFRLNA